MKLKRTILSFLLGCIYIFATLGAVLFNTCEACCAENGHESCKRCCHCGHEEGDDDGSSRFDCNCACHVHSHDAVESSVVVLPQGRDDLGKKLVKKVSAKAGMLFVLPEEVETLSLRGYSCISYGDRSCSSPSCCAVVKGLRAPPVIS